MKLLTLSFLAAFFAAGVMAQTEPVEGTLDYQKGQKRVAIVEVPFPPDIVEGAIKDNLAKSGVKEERLKGLQVFKGARMQPTDGEVADLYFKVDRKSRKESNVSVVYMIVGRPNENVALRTPDDAYRMQDAKAFLSGLQPRAESYDLDVNINRNDDNIKKGEKKLSDLQDDKKRLEKKISEQEQELNRLKTERETLLGKRNK